MKRKNIVIFSLLVVVFLIIAGIGMYFILPEEKLEEKKIDEINIDDRISPGTNQGLTVEILRIRHRGLMDKMLELGFSWRNTPSFYWDVKVDNKESSSQGNVGKTGVYQVWDTILWESRHIFYIEEEQDKSSVEISIIQKEKTGIFKTEDVEKENIKVIFDYRTGRWSGDDYFRDDDGYGHYLGETFEVWFNMYQSADLDRDYIPYWVEVNVLGTDPYVDDSKLDPDNDKIPTFWEWRWGYDPFVWNDHENLDPDIDGIENIEEYHMSKYFANPYQPDMYIETDGMEKKGFLDVEHTFHTESQQMIIERFAQHGIWVYIDDGWIGASTYGNGGGQKLPFIESIDENTGGQICGFYKHYFSDDRKGIFRYVIIANKQGWCTPCEGNAYDTILAGNGLEVSLKKRLVFSPRYMRVTVAKGVLHELGHSIGLMPWGFYGNDIKPPVPVRYPTELTEEEYENYLYDYYSILNYYYIWRDRKLFDYSDGSNGEYDQNDWYYIYLPTFQVDSLAFEEPNELDPSFEDIETVDETRELVFKGWEYSEELTEKYSNSILSSVNTINRENEVAVLINDKSKNVKVYLKPLIEPTFTVWSLISEGSLDSEGEIDFYSQQEIIQEVKSQI